MKSSRNTSMIDRPEEDNRSSLILDNEVLTRLYSENALEGIAVHRNGKFVDVNEQFARLLGYSRSELHGRSVLECVHQSSRDTVIENIANKTNRFYDIILVRKDGELLYVEVKGLNTRVDGTEVRITVIRDISKRREIENDLVRNERKWRHLFENMRDGWVTVDMEGVFQSCNKAYEEITGYSLGELKTMDFMKLTPEKWREWEQKIVIEKIMKIGYSGLYVKEYTHKDGRIIPIEIEAYLIRDEEGKPAGMWGQVRDISLRVRAEKELRESEEKFRSISYSMADWIWEVDTGGRYTFTSGNVEQILGYTSDELLGKTPFDIMPEDESEKIREKFGEITGAAKPFKDLHNKVLTKDGQEVIFSTSGMPVFNEKGDLSGYRGVDRDITVEVKSREELRIYKDHLEELVEERTSKLRELNEKLQLEIDERKAAESALIRSEGNLRRAQEVGQIGSWFIDARKRPIHVSPETCRILGFKEKEKLSEATLLKKVLPGDRKKVLKNWNEALKSGGFDFEYRVNKEGQVRWIRTKAELVRDPAGSPVSLTGIVQDITSGKQAENILRERNEDSELINQLNSAANEGKSLNEILALAANYTKNIFSGMGAAVYLLDSSKEFLYLENTDVVSRFINTLENLLGKKIPGIRIPVNSDHEYIRVLKVGEPRYFEGKQEISKIYSDFASVMTPKDNIIARTAKSLISRIYKLINIQAVFTIPLKIDNEIIGLLDMGSATHYTESDKSRIRDIAIQIGQIIHRKRTEEALHESEERIRAFAEALPDVAFIIDEEGRYIEILTSNENLLYKNSGELKGRLLHEVLPREDADKFLGVVQSTIESGETQIIEYTHRVQEGVLWFEGRTSPVRGTSSDKELVVWVSRDITSRIKADTKLKNTLSELERSNKELEQFAYVASHDLQEPLRKVKSFAELLELRNREQLDEKSSSYIQHVVNGSTRMQTLISDLLMFSRVTTRAKEFTRTSLNRVLEQTLDILDLSIKESQATIEYDELPDVYADESQMVQVFQNLIGNSIKFRNEALPVIQVNSEQRNDEWIFSIRDNGIGFEEEYREKIFVVFQRLHSRERYQGTGIGLAICKKIIERHRGKIWVESELHKGTTFYFSLPINKS